MIMCAQLLFLWPSACLHSSTTQSNVNCVVFLENPATLALIDGGLFIELSLYNKLYICLSALLVLCTAEDLFNGILWNLSLQEHNFSELSMRTMFISLQSAARA